MTRQAGIIALSVVACVFGGLSLGGPEDQRSLFYACNVALSVAASILASMDLRKRGYAWGWAMLGAYLLPLIGTILYIVFSTMRGYEASAEAQQSAQV